MLVLYMLIVITVYYHYVDFMLISYVIFTMDEHVVEVYDKCIRALIRIGKMIR